MPSDIARQRAHEAGFVRECLYLVALLELGRARDEPVAPPMFDEQNATYQEALPVALKLTEREMTRSITKDVWAMLDRRRIVFRGRSAD